MCADKDTWGTEMEVPEAIEAPTKTEIKVEDLKENSEPTSATNGASDNELDHKIIQQIEFYFGDANLPRDKFMLEQVKLDNGWIPMSTMLTFPRLAKLSTNPDVIANAVKSSQLVKVDTTGTEAKLRRSPEMPLPESYAEWRKSTVSRTIYCKGFPLDFDKDAVMNFIHPHGTPETLIMRNHKDKLTRKYMFKGSILVTFKTQEEANAFYEKEDVKVGDTVLEKIWQNDYNEMKNELLRHFSEAKTCWVTFRDSW